jgi:hypothetical protein
MSQKTNAAETLVLQWLLTNVAVTRPTAWFLALHSANPGEAGTGNELSGNGYARQPIAFAVSADQAINTATISFGPASGANWLPASHFTVCTTPSGGTPLYYGAILDPQDGITPMPVTVVANARAEFGAGSLVLIEG